MAISGGHQCHHGCPTGLIGECGYRGTLGDEYSILRTHKLPRWHQWKVRLDGNLELNRQQKDPPDTVTQPPRWFGHATYAMHWTPTYMTHWTTCRHYALDTLTLRWCFANILPWRFGHYGMPPLWLFGHSSFATVWTHYPSDASDNLPPWWFGHATTASHWTSDHLRSAHFTTSNVTQIIQEFLWILCTMEILLNS